MNFWTVVDGELIHYKRIGECNQCGECCRSKSTITFEITAGVSKDKKEDEELGWAPWEDWNLFYAQSIWWYFRIWFDADKEACCESLTEDGRCSIHEEFTEKPAICTYWPMHPDHVKAFPGCSYSFERIEEDAVGNT